MLYYVQRDKSGVIVGLYANPQPQPDGSSLTDPTPLPDTDPALAAFLSPQASLKVAPVLPSFATANDLAAFLRAKSLI